MVASNNMDDLTKKKLVRLWLNTEQARARENIEQTFSYKQKQVHGGVHVQHPRGVEKNLGDHGEKFIPNKKYNIYIV
jgi:hypothetical protein